MKSPKKLSRKELFWYVLAGIIGVTGLLFLVFGIVGDHFPGLYADNWIAASENAWLKNWSGLGYRYWGIILIAAGAFIAIVALAVFAKEGDRDSDRERRRAQRLGATVSPVVDVTPEEKTEA